MIDILKRRNRNNNDPEKIFLDVAKVCTVCARSSQPKSTNKVSLTHVCREINEKTQADFMLQTCAKQSTVPFLYCRLRNAMVWMCNCNKQIHHFNGQHNRGVADTKAWSSMLILRRQWIFKEAYNIVSQISRYSYGKPTYPKAYRDRHSRKKASSTRENTRTASKRKLKRDRYNSALSSGVLIQFFFLVTYPICFSIGQRLHPSTLRLERKLILNELIEAY